MFLSFNFSNHCRWCSSCSFPREASKSHFKVIIFLSSGSLNHWILVLPPGPQDYYAWNFDYIIIDSGYPGFSYNLHVIHLTKRHRILYWLSVFILSYEACQTWGNYYLGFTQNHLGWLKNWCIQTEYGTYSFLILHSHGSALHPGANTFGSSLLAY